MINEKFYNVDLKKYENNEKVDGIFIIQKFNVLQDKNKQNYGDIVLANKNGSYVARMWKIPDIAIEEFKNNEVMLISGTVSEYMNVKQITILKTKVPADDSYDPSLLVPSSKNDPDEMLSFIENTINEIPEDNNKLKQLKLIANRTLNRNKYIFKFIGGAKTNHHNYRNGLLEHSYNVLRNCMNDVEIYGDKNINKYLLYCGAILHDIGKTREYKFNSFVIVTDYTREGILIGHISIGAGEIEIAAEELKKEGIEIDRDVITDLKHLILAHHGKLEYGSPKIPMLKEAEILFRADCRDAFMEMFDNVISASGDAEFSERQYALEGRQITSNVFDK